LTKKLKRICSIFYIQWKVPWLVC